MGINCSEPNRKAHNKIIYSFTEDSKYNNSSLNNGNYINNSFNGVPKPNQFSKQFPEKPNQNNSKPLYNNKNINENINQVISNEYKLYELYEKAQRIHNKYREKHHSQNLDLIYYNS